MNSTHQARAVAPAEWEAARLRLLAKEQDLTRARDALAADRRRMPWLKVDQEYVFDGPNGTVRLPDLFDGRRQLQEDWEDSPAGYPQVPRFSWLNRHDEYGPTEPASPAPSPRGADHAQHD